MATPRQNPQFDPQRIVQPTASPIDTYFQPMLAQPEQPKILQVAAALADISPQLNRLSSDAMAANIAAQKEYGQYEALTERDPDVARRRATEAIEGSGGIAPWRYQSYLEAYGQRLVRDKYRNALYKNLDDLSNPYNADGTIRAPTYVGEQMTKLYDEAGIPQDSYYMNKGAAAARAEADNSFYERLMGARRQKVLQSSKDAFADGIQFNINITPDIEKMFEPGGGLETLAKTYYENGGQDGDDILTQGILNAAQGAVSEGNYDRAQGILRRAMDGPVGTRSIGKRHQPRFAEALEIYERKEQEAELNDARTLEGRKQLALISVNDALLLELQQTTPASGQMILSQTEINDRVTKAISGSKVSDDIKLAVQARAAESLRVNIDALNRSIGEPKKDTRTTNMALDGAYQNSQFMPPAEFNAYITGMLDKDLISFGQAQELRQQNKNFFSQSESDRAHVALALSGISESRWTGLEKGQIAIDGQSKLNSIGNEASLRVMTAYTAKINSLEFRKLYPDDTQRSLAQNQVFDEIVSKEKAALLTKHSKMIAEYDLSASYEANVGAFAKQEIPSFVGFVLTDLGFEEGLESSRLGARLGQHLDAELKKEWASLSAEAGAPPLSLSDRRQKWFEVVENVKDRFIDTLQNNPQLLNLSPTLSTSLNNKKAEKSGSVGTGEVEAVRGTVSSPTDVSRAITTSNPSKSVIRGSAYQTWGNKYTVTPLFPSESSLFDTAGRASKTYRSIQLAAENGSLTPEMQQQHNIDKAAMGVEAERYIADFTSTTIQDARSNPTLPWIPAGYYNGRYRSMPTNKNVPLFIFKDNGVYVAMQDFSSVEPAYAGDVVENKVVYTPVPDLSERYWAAKAVTGYSKDEVTSGRTAEGVRITPAQLDPREFLLFKSPEEFSTALAEYTTTSGKSGFIAELLPRTGMTYEVFRATQLKLLGMRKPLLGTPQAQ